MLEYYQGKFLQETIGKDNPMSASKMRYKTDLLRRTTHKTGVLIPKPIEV